ncbi:aromatic acid exporter family protein [Aquibacillus sp. 3ASR75-11]|uniref:Aromatic acid exporter family protein n=1 Tax=Terrihalobacillus insolitus TaxID=2950438 RepID=A0A9X3WWD0_9BACI|nr:aromatic acid exporter family protein [Terrihalobacillus insolitus]MDC3414461.1 aromatic acid exporter family protein [Terrihalobacillus insolitus]MDC3425341.1 aromatic acid exporter family protein [Terrihalobacillus insolitus]
MRIGYRTLKTAVGTPIAIWIAQLMQLDGAVSAGILTILCIQTTRKSSVLSAWHRFIATLLAMFISIVVFESLTYHPITIGIVLLLFIPITVKWKITPGIVTSTVIILHLYQARDISFQLIGNELLLITVGIGTALLLNLYMPSLDKKLLEYQERLEHHFKVILKEIATFLRDGDQAWSGKELTETEVILDHAESYVVRDIENHLLRSHHPFYSYFQMRRKQFELLKRMLPLASQLNHTYAQSFQMATFFDELSDSVHPGNTSTIFLEKVHRLKKKFEEDALPQTREEFETRANLYRLLQEIEQYLILKKTINKNGKPAFHKKERLENTKKNKD